jgi:hypothetical protein
MDSPIIQTGLVDAGQTPNPEDGQSDRYHRGQNPNTNNAASSERPAVLPAGLTSRQATEIRFTVGQRP